MKKINKPDSSRFKSNRIVIGLASSAILLLIVTAVAVVLTNRGNIHNKATSHWNYHDQDEWSGWCNIGRLQSPIALNKVSSKKSAISPLIIENADDYIEGFQVDNDGHTVRVSFDISNQSLPKLSGAGLLKNYTLDNFHFHWPSEHTINGIHYTLEGHFAFYADEYRNLTNALKYPGGVTVLAILFDESETVEVEHHNFEAIDDAVKRIPKAGQSTVSEEKLILGNFLPQNNKAFLKYTGSLTTPECNENVNWIIFTTPSKIRKKEFDQLSQIYSENGEHLQFNNRLIQPTNGRIIELSQPSD